MNDTFRRSFTWLHTWIGVSVGWILFAMFVTGTAAYFREEITQWMQPEVQSPKNLDARATATNAIRYLEEHAPRQGSWGIELPDARHPLTHVFWGPTPVEGPALQRRGELIARIRGPQSQTLGPDGSPIALRATNGGDFLFLFHLSLNLQLIGQWVVGFCGSFMLVTLVAGAIIHHRIFADFFTLRLNRGQRSWLDAHTTVAALALPYFIVITYTGLAGISTTFMPWGGRANYSASWGESLDNFYDVVFPRDRVGPPSGTAAPLAPIGPMLDQARRQWGGDQVETIFISYPGDAAARVEMIRSAYSGLYTRFESIQFNGVSGAMTFTSAKPGLATRGWESMVSLHTARYAPLALRWFYFTLGLMGITTVGTGLVLWTAKRRAKQAQAGRFELGFAVVERLNIGTLVGLPIGVASYFWANRLLSVDLSDRAGVEVRCLFAAWAAALAYAVLRSPRRAWSEELSVAAALFAGIPLLNALTTPRNLPASLLHHDWVFAGFDTAMLAIAAVFAIAAWKVGFGSRTSRPTQLLRSNYAEVS